MILLFCKFSLLSATTLNELPQFSGLGAFILFTFSNVFFPSQFTGYYMQNAASDMPAYHLMHYLPLQWFGRYWLHGQCHLHFPAPFTPAIPVTDFLPKRLRHHLKRMPYHFPIIHAYYCLS